MTAAMVTPVTKAGIWRLKDEDVGEGIVNKGQVEVRVGRASSHCFCSKQ